MAAGKLIIATDADAKELEACFGARLRELDKAFKSCIKGGVQSAAEKVSERIATVKRLQKSLDENQ